MNFDQLLEQALEITSKFPPKTKPWQESMSDLSTTYFQEVGFSIPAAMDMETVASICHDRWSKTSDYLNREYKL